jgi:hypothetical protein
VFATQFLHGLGWLEVVAECSALCAITFRRQWRDYWGLGSLLSVRVLSGILLGVLIHVPRTSGAQDHAVYVSYFYTYWSSYAIESILGLILIYSIFRLAMAPLKGLQGLGMLVFRWAAAISTLVAIAAGFSPHIETQKYLSYLAGELQRTQSILTLCLLMFVCFAIRPMGLSYRSRIFGVSLGLGISATTDLARSAWVGAPLKLFASYQLVSAVASFLAVVVWTVYFALPEPKRRIIVLPTTSPFLRWNQISLALGDEPGFVAVGGVHPDLFAPAELEVMRRASLKMVTPFPKSLRA